MDWQKGELGAHFSGGRNEYCMVSDIPTMVVYRVLGLRRMWFSSFLSGRAKVETEELRRVLVI